MNDPQFGILSTRKGVFLLVLLLSLLMSFQSHIAITTAAFQETVQPPEAYPLAIRISNITWEFHHYNELDETSEFSFEVDLEIWNKDNETYTISSSDSCVFRLQAHCDLEDKSLSFQFYYVCAPAVTYVPIDPGLQNGTREGHAWLTKTNTERLVTGHYRILPLIQDNMENEDAFPLENSYGVNITVSEEGHTIVYDALPAGWPSPSENTTNGSQPTFPASATDSPKTPQTGTSSAVGGVLGLSSLAAISFLLILRSKRRSRINSGESSSKTMQRSRND
jgi:LPXTG-motif cell wall-anchored protein